jgi:hypothetical protein
MLSLSSDRPQVGPAGFAELVAREDSMKIARFDGGRIGIVVGDTIRDVTATAGVDPAESAGRDGAADREFRFAARQTRGGGLTCHRPPSLDQLLRERWYPIGVTAARPKVHPYVATIGPTQVGA